MCRVVPSKCVTVYLLHKRCHLVSAAQKVSPCICCTKRVPLYLVHKRFDRVSGAPKVSPCICCTKGVTVYLLHKIYHCASAAQHPSQIKVSYSKSVIVYIIVVSSCDFVIYLTYQVVVNLFYNVRSS